MIFIGVSICCHLVVLQVKTQKDSVKLLGSQHNVGHVSQNLEKFLPDKLQMKNVVSSSDISVKHHLVEESPPAEQSVSHPASKQKIPITETVVKGSPNSPIKKSTQEIELSSLTEGKHSEVYENPQTEEVHQTLLPKPLPSTLKVASFRPIVRAVPSYADNRSPSYPVVARRKGWEGEVRLLVRVGETGRVGKISIESSSGYSILDRAARRAVRGWTFIPATAAGQNVASEVVIPVDFHLPENK